MSEYVRQRRGSTHMQLVSRKLQQIVLNEIIPKRIIWSTFLHNKQVSYSDTFDMENWGIVVSTFQNYKQSLIK